MAQRRSFDSHDTSKGGDVAHIKKQKFAPQAGQGQPVKHKTKYGEWNFDVDYNDHFETPPIAYVDLKNVLDVLCTKLGKTADQLIIYDPYWCKGNMVSHLAALGYTNVINKNRDFYNDIRCKQVPAYDILVTNPPYSGEHKVKLLAFLSKRPEPFALLLPAYTATKSYWRDFTTASPTAVISNSNPKNTNNISSSPNPSSTSSSSSSSPSSSTCCFYLMPPDHYEYLHPEGTGKDLPPFYSCWFLGGLTPADKRSVIQRVSATPRRAASSSSSTGSAGGSSVNGPKKLPFSVLTVLESVEGMIRLGLVTAQRPNPKLRKKLKSKMMGQGK